MAADPVSDASSSDWGGDLARADTGSLVWLLPELRGALEQAVSELRRFGGQTHGLEVDLTPLRLARSHLHQAHGALQVVDLEGVSLVTEEVEHLLETFEAKPERCDDTALAAIAAACRSVVEYLEELLSGAPHQPVRLYPSYRTLLQLRGADRIHPADLFYPDLSVRPPRVASEGRVLSSEEIAEERGRFEEALLRFLRDDRDLGAAASLSRAVTAIEGSVSRTARQGQQRAYWWVTRALFEALAADAFRGVRSQDLNLKRLAARINLQIRRLLEGSGTIAERLLRDTLFFVARAEPATPHVRAVKALYRLEQALPDDFETERYGKLDAVALRAAKEGLCDAKGAWSAVVAGDSAQIAAFARETGALLQAVGQLGKVGLAQVAQVIASIATELSFDPRKPAETVGLDVATALLFLDGALDQIRALDDGFDERAAAVVARVEASALGRAAPAGEVPWLDKISRQAEERLTMASFVGEMQANLRAAEKALDAFFRDPAARGELPEAQKSLAQIGGALAVLGHEDTQRAVDAARASIRGFEHESYQPDAAEFERVAQNLGAVGFYVEQLQQHGDSGANFRFDPDSGSFTADIARAPTPPASSTADDDDGSAHIEAAYSTVDAAYGATPLADAKLESTLEQEIAQRGGDAAQLAKSLGENPDDEMARDLLITALESVRHDSVLIDDSALHDQAVAALQLIEESSARGETFSPEAASGLSESIAMLTSRADRAAGLERPAAIPVAPSSPVPSGENMAAIDAELLEIFLEEAQEVLAASREALTRLQQHAFDTDALSTARRGFHTLKGSGRMVGLTALGDAAWSIEQTLNPYLAEARAVTPELCALLDYAIRYVEAWVQELRASGMSSRSADALVEAAAAVRTGDNALASETSMIFSGSGASTVYSASGVAHGAPTHDHDDLPEQGASSPAAAEAQDDINFAATQFIGDDAAEGGDIEFFGVQPSHPEAQQPPTHEDESEVAHFDIEPIDLSTDALAVAPVSDAEPPTITADATEDAAPPLLGMDDASPIGEVRPPHDEPAGSDEQRSTHAANEHSADAQNQAHDDDAPGAKPATSATILPFGAPESLPRADEFRRIGSLTLSVPLFNIYLSEADELLRVLTQDFGEWRHEIARSVSEGAMRAAHSLSGSSSTVGLSSAHDLAAAIEAVLQSVLRAPVALHDGEVAQLQDAVEALRAMLHRFAAEVLPEADPQRIASLAALRSALAFRHESGRHVEAHAVDEAHLRDERRETGATERKAEHVVEEESAESDDLATEAPLPHTGGDRSSLVSSGAVIEPVAAVENAGGPAGSEAVARAEPPPAVPPVDHFPESPSPSPSMSPRVLGAQRAIRDEVDPELIEIFIQEGGELLPQIGANLRSWQAEPGNHAPAAMLLRQLHTIKGSARMAGAMRLGEVVHDMEARVESAARLHEIPAALFDELLAAHDRGLELFDGLQHLVDGPASNDIEASAQAMDALRDATSQHDEIGGDDVDAILDAIQHDVDDRGVEARPNALTGRALAKAPLPAGGAAPAVARTVRSAAVHQAVRVRADVLDRLVNQAGEVSISRARVENEIGQIKTSLADLTENVARLRGQLREIEIQAEFQLQSQMQSQAALGREKEKFDPLEFDRFTRFQELTRMMAESVNDVATVQQNLLKSLDSADRDLSAQQRMTHDLQQDLMRVRMVPFSSIAERLYRVARQTAKELDKRVNLDIRGGSVEIDRSVLERMIGPFEHLLRNHIVHGVESRAARRAAGKNETGELLVEVRQEGNEIVLTFSDDGAGLDLARIREKAAAVGLIGHDEDVSAPRAADLIFHPGLSTATEVTELAGRGVGMDVVRSEAGALAGRVTVDTTPGQGTRFTINLPLTLAVTQVVLVSVAGRVHALPAVLVEQVQQLRAQPLAEAYNAGHLMWLGEPVKLHFLASLLGVEGGAPIAQRYSPLLILRSAGERVAVHVDEIVGNQEVVVKNLGPQLARMTGIAGATVLGSGEIVLILNPVQLAQMAARERPSLLQAPTQAEIGGAVAELLDGSAARGDSGRVDVVRGLETLPTVMVVDDSLTVRRVTQRLLAREGYQVVLAKDGVDALEQLQEYTPDAMLVDIEMPRMDGFDLTRNVRTDERFRHIPIIMITSRTADKHRQHAAKLGVNEYLGKPYQEDELLALLARHVKARQRVAV